MAEVDTEPPFNPARNITTFIRACTPSEEHADGMVFDDVAAARVLSGGMSRVFGGATMVQALVAAGRTAPDATLRPHALHATFLEAGDVALPISYAVERLRDGRGFVARRVRAQQGDRLLTDVVVTLMRPQAGRSFAAPMPAAPAPEGLPPFGWWEVFPPEAHPPLRAGRLDDGRLVRRVHATSGEIPTLTFWLRPVAALPDDALLRAAFLLYESDSATGAFMGGGLSLDHQVWWHSVPPLDDWLLFARETPVIADGRALMLGGMYDRDGTRCLSVAQEFLQAPPRAR